MSLLRALTSNPLDVDTLRGTEGTHEEVSPPDTPVTRILTVAAAIALGFVVAVSATTLRDAATADDSPRAVLEQRVRETQAEADAAETRRDDTVEEINALQGRVLESADSGAADRLEAYERAAGAVALTGPGAVLTLEDSAPLPATPGTDGGTVNRVTDIDLQIAVNGLWASGAEAVSINGQRVTSTSAIRRAGDAVLVDFRPLSPPYVVTALGDGAALRTGVEESATGSYLADLSTRYGIRSAWSTGEELTVPARSVATLREAAEIDPSRGPAPGDGAADETLPPSTTPEETS